MKEFWMPLGRLVKGEVPILGPKMGSIFCEDSMPRVCKSVPGDSFSEYFLGVSAFQ